MDSEYTPPLLHRNSHFAAILPHQFRKFRNFESKRIRIETPDGDFLDIDLYNQYSTRAAILVHGLEGSSQSGYIQGMAKQMKANGNAAICMNFRGCSGQPNQKFESYHSGKTDDLQLVIDYALKEFEKIYLIGFSLGGNVVLKYAGEKGNTIDKCIKAAVGISVPIDLAGSCKTLALKENTLYNKRFIRQLSKKAIAKAKAFPEKGIDSEAFKKLKDLCEFDNLYTAPAHGFQNADDYYKQCSSKQYLNKIWIPSLLINAKNDSFLSENCYLKEDEIPAHLTYLEPNFGGHVGFASDHFFRKAFWSEKKVLEFIRSIA